MDPRLHVGFVRGAPPSRRVVIEGACSSETAFEDSDAAVVWADPCRDGWRTRPVGSHPVVVALAPTDPLARRRQVPLDALGAGAASLTTTVDGQRQRELTEQWLAGGGNDAISRSVQRGKLTPQQADDLRDAVASGADDRELVVVRTPPNGNSVSRTIGTTTGLDGTDGGPPVSVTVVELFPPAGTSAALLAEVAAEEERSLARMLVDPGRR